MSRANEKLTTFQSRQHSSRTIASRGAMFSRGIASRLECLWDRSVMHVRIVLGCFPTIEHAVIAHNPHTPKPRAFR
jgi:hypothetical protein